MEISVPASGAAGHYEQGWWRWVMRAWALWLLGLAVACSVAPMPETSPGGTIIASTGGTGGSGESGGGAEAPDAGLA